VIVDSERVVVGKIARDERSGKHEIVTVEAS